MRRACQVTRRCLAELFLDKGFGHRSHSRGCRYHYIARSKKALHLAMQFFPDWLDRPHVIFLYRLMVEKTAFGTLQTTIGGVTEDRRLQLLLGAQCSHTNWIGWTMRRKSQIERVTSKIDIYLSKRWASSS